MKWNNFKSKIISDSWNAQIKNFTARILFFLLAFIVLRVLLATFFVYIKPNEYGIKQVNIGLKTGIQKDVYQAGYHFLVPFGFQMRSEEHTSELQSR